MFRTATLLLASLYFLASAGCAHLLVLPPWRVVLPMSPLSGSSSDPLFFAASLAAVQKRMDYIEATVAEKLSLLQQIHYHFARSFSSRPSPFSGASSRLYGQLDSGG